MSEHLSPEVMAALIDGSVAVPERSEVMEHLDRCDRCLEIYAESLRLAHGKGRPTATSRPAWMAAAAVVLIGLALGVWWAEKSPTGIDGKLESLALAVQRHDLSNAVAGSRAFTANTPGPVETSFRLGVTEVRLEIAEKRRWSREVEEQRKTLEALEHRNVGPDHTAPTEAFRAFGRWCESLRLALRAGIDPARVIDPAHDWSDLPAGGPPGLETDLERLRSALDAGDSDEAERTVLGIMSLL